MVQTPSTSETFFGLDISDLKNAFLKIRRKISKRYLILEFGIDNLTYGEASIKKDQVSCSKINRAYLDQEAIERGTPTDPKAMGAFLKQIIDEDQIWATRVAITLPPEASLSKIINLPDKLSYEEAINFIRDPSKSGFQFPISLEQTDFDIVPLNCLPINKTDNTRPYFLTSVPKKLVNNVINTLREANLELHCLDISYSSLQRLASEMIKELNSNQAIILLDLCFECTHLYLINGNGPIKVSTHAAIRAFEAPKNHTGDQSIEDITINNENYLAISQLDLKVLLTEIKKEITAIKFNTKLDITNLVLSGINSSHPGIANLFENRLKINTSILRTLSTRAIRDIQANKSICSQELNRLIGLSLTMLESDNYLPENKSINNKIIPSEILNELDKDNKKNIYKSESSKKLEYVIQEKNETREKGIYDSNDVKKELLFNTCNDEKDINSKDKIINLEVNKPNSEETQDSFSNFLYEIKKTNQTPINDNKSKPISNEFTRDPIKLNNKELVSNKSKDKTRKMKGINKDKITNSSIDFFDEMINSKKRCEELEISNNNESDFNLNIDKNQLKFDDNISFLTDTSASESENKFEQSKSSKKDSEELNTTLDFNDDYQNENKSNDIKNNNYNSSEKSEIKTEIDSTKFDFEMPDP